MSTLKVKFATPGMCFLRLQSRDHFIETWETPRCDALPLWCQSCTLWHASIIACTRLGASDDSGLRFLASGSLPFQRLKRTQIQNSANDIGFADRRLAVALVEDWHDWHGFVALSVSRQCFHHFSLCLSLRAAYPVKISSA